MPPGDPRTPPSGDEGCRTPAPSSAVTRSQLLLETLRGVIADPALATSEQELQERLGKALGSCELELRTTFAAPLHAAKQPPRTAILELERKGRRIASEGRDPCSQRGKLDILWHVEDEFVPIELKFVSERKSDVWGYQFLKDIHRLERLIAAEQHSNLAARRFAMFVTCEPVYWRGGRPEPAPFSLREGSHTIEKAWIQYDQKSPDTLWYSYPPFYLSGRYRFDWHDVERGFRALLVEVTAQTASPGISS